MRKTKNRVLHKNIISMAVLFLILIIIFLAAFQRIEKIVEERCFRVLMNTVEQGADNIRTMIEGDEQRMEAIAGMLASHTGLQAEDCQKHLDSLKTNHLFSSFSILLPNNQMIYPHNTAALMDTLPDYETESKKDPCFYSIYKGISSEEYSVYSFPIVTDGKTMGVLYGYIRLKDLPKKFTFSAFDNQAQLYLVDGNTGDFLMDTWHDKLGNMYDSDLAHRKTKAGTKFEQTKLDVKNGNSGYIVFESKTTGDDFYSYYSPVGKYNLSFQITVPRSVAFSDSIRIQRIILIFSSIQILIAICYTFFKLHKAWTQNRNTQQKMKLTSAINEAQHMLFGIYENTDFVNEALKVLAKALESEQIFFVILENDSVKKLYSLPAIRKEEQKNDHNQNITEAIQLLFATQSDKKSMILDDKCREKLELAGQLPGIKANGLKNVVAAWEVNADKNIYSIMYAVNVKNPNTAGETLEMIAGSFRQAIQTMDSYSLLYQMGEVDSMTGLKNRNAYQKDLVIYNNCKSQQLCCIYLDANGLHDLNNQYGHASGDKMLTTIGCLAKELFGFDNSYRIGGDEFVLFCIDMKRALVLQQIQSLQDRLSEKEYHISVGIAFRKDGQHIQQLITNAEMKMYERKRAFYNTDGHREHRQHNQELENVLLEKRDKDSFLNAISASFLGVYVVNLITDMTRTIYKPNYFDNILKKTDYYYLPALQQYAKEFISDQDYEMVMKFLNYEQITQNMIKGLTIECCYHKKDGMYVRVRVLPMEEYSDTQKDTLWIFEKYSPSNE